MFTFIKKKVTLVAPMTGKVIDLMEVPDIAFAQKMVGDGIAIEPTDGLVLAPCEGKVVQIFPTNHAIGIETKAGIDILIHLGIDTVELKGDGFERLIEEGEWINTGTPLLKMDIDKIKRYGKHTITPVLITTMDKVESVDFVKGHVIAGKDRIITVKMK